MVDYFQAPDGSAGVTNGAALPANGDTNMDDDVMVRLLPTVCVRSTDSE
jgi:hypothetical protein